jgi:glycolate oxidase subunit GlcD
MQRVDPAIFSTNPVRRITHAYDATNVFSFPDAVVRPRNVQDLQDILDLANAADISLFPRGAGTGFSGGSVPVDGGVVIDGLGMNRLLDIDERDMIACVEPGLVTEALNQAVEKRHLFYPPDPASLKTCTLGGNVAENAGGPRCLKYGVTRDYVLAIDGFTGSGKSFVAGKGIYKNRAGYDLKHLLIGSEGTLAVFSRFLLKLIPKPEAKILFSAFFSDVAAAAEMVNTLLHKGIQPSSLEFMDQMSLQAVERLVPSGLPVNHQALLLIETDGRQDEMPVFREKVLDCLNSLAAEIRVAIDPEEQEALWDIRRRTSPAMRLYGDTKTNEDIVVPRKHVPEALNCLKQLGITHELNVIAFGHIGDGNIHVNILFDRDDMAAVSRVNPALNELFAMVNRLGGAVSGEHGIGLAKKAYLPGNIDAVSYELMKSVKRCFDPKNILNPNKMFLP